MTPCPSSRRVRRPHRDSRGDNGWSLGGAAKGLGLRIGRDRGSLTWGEAGKQARTRRTVCSSWTTFHPL